MSEEPEVLEPESDPVKIVLAFTRYLEGRRTLKTGGKKICPVCKHGFDPMMIRERDEYLVTILLSLLADPHHHVGKLITRNLFKTWIDRGGQIPVQGTLSRALKEKDTFEFAIQYLYDYGLAIKEIANALGCCQATVRQSIRYWGASNKEHSEEPSKEKSTET